MKIFDRNAWLALSVSLLMTVVAPAWDYEGHRTVNQLALAALPPDFPAFVRESANAERVAFLSGEPDRWRNTADLPIKHFNGVDHYCDLEQLTEAGLTPATVSALRYEFALQFAAGRGRIREIFRHLIRLKTRIVPVNGRVSRRGRLPNITVN